MKKSSNKGFTLVELIIVIAILAIIMLIAIPNFSGIQQRMKVRADKSTAAQIGKAVRVWYTDYTSDPLLEATLATGDADEDKLFMDGGKLVDYRELTGIEAYAAKTYEPGSLLNASKASIKGYYLVGLTSANASEGKVCVAIKDAATTVDVPASAAVNYDGETAANIIAYIEP